MFESRRIQQAGYQMKSEQNDSNADDWQSVLTKADALFSRGDYERALVLYHRGKRMRPKAKQFRTGISMCEEAIANHTESDMAGGRSIRLGTSSATTYGRMTEKTKHTRQTGRTRQSQTTTAQSERKRDVEHIVGLEKDKHYLLGLLQQLETEQLGHSNSIPRSQLISKSAHSIKSRHSIAASVVEKSLKLVDTRSVYWQQQMPVHIIRSMKETTLHSKFASKSTEKESETASFNKAYAALLAKIMRANEVFLAGKFQSCVNRTEECIKQLKKYRSSEVNNKYEILSSLHGLLGNAWFEQEHYTDALENYAKDLEISEEKELLGSRSRALENLGRVYARVGEFDAAINVWQEKLAMHGEENGEAWLYHEIGYCYLAKEDYQTAKICGENALDLAKTKPDLQWQLNSCLLIAQADAKMKEYERSHKYFRRACDFAKYLNDDQLTQSIEETLHDCERVIKYHNAAREAEAKRQREERVRKAKEEEARRQARRVEGKELENEEDENEDESEAEETSREHSDSALQSKKVRIDDSEEEEEEEEKKLEKPKEPEPEKKKTLEYQAPQRRGLYQDMTIDRFRQELKQRMEDKKAGIIPEEEQKKKKQKQKPQQPEKELEQLEYVPEEPQNPEKKPEPKPKAFDVPPPKQQFKTTPSTLLPQKETVQMQFEYHQQQHEELNDSPRSSEPTKKPRSQSPAKDKGKKALWKSKYKEKPAKELTIVFKTGTSKQVQLKQGAQDDEDSDGEYNKIVKIKRNVKVNKTKGEKLSTEFVQTPYGATMNENKSPDKYVAGYNYSSIQSVPVACREDTFVRREASFYKVLHKEGSFVKAMKREGSMNREGSFTKPASKKPPKAPASPKRTRTFHEQGSTSTLRSVNNSGPSHNSLSGDIPFAHDPRLDSHLFHPRRLLSQKNSGLSQSLPSISYKKASHKRSNLSLLEVDKPSSKSTLPKINKSKSESNRISESGVEGTSPCARVTNETEESTTTTLNNNGKTQDMKLFKMLLSD